MSAQQGSAGGRGPGGKPKGGPQSGSTGRSSSTTGPAAGGPSTGRPSAGQGAAKGPGVSGPSPTYTETTGGQQSARGGASFGSDAPYSTVETTDGPIASKKGCGCCAGVMTAIIFASVVSFLYFLL